MPHKMETPALGAPGQEDPAFSKGCTQPATSPAAPQGKSCDLEEFPSAKISQAKIEILIDDITDTAGWLVDTLRCLPTQRVAGDIDGLLHSLRRARGYWRVISGEASLLAAAHGDLLSAERQEGSQ
jgi:hypothetical protein